MVIELDRGLATVLEGMIAELNDSSCSEYRRHVYEALNRFIMEMAKHNNVSYKEATYLANMTEWVFIGDSIPPNAKIH